MKKTLIPLCLFLVCVFAGIGASAEEAMVRVGLKYGNSAVSSAEFMSEYGLKFYNAVTGELLYTSAANEKVTVAKSGSGFASDGKFTAAGIKKLSVQSVNSTPITYGGAKYRGYFLLDISGGENITVINNVHMNQYLYSVLGKEMSASFPIEALKAQAICAKNFVLGEKNRHSGAGFDVCATTHCQVYAGVSSEADSTVKAVDAVDGKAAYYDGEIVPLYFFATSGGKTESVENVWGMKVPYLVSVDDPYEPADKASNYTWTATLTAEEISERLAAKNMSVGTVTEITVDKTAPSGRVLELTFNGTGGSKTVTRSECRSVIGTDKLYSQWFTVSSDGSGGSADVMMSVNGAVGGTKALTSKGTAEIKGKKILSADGITEFSGGVSSAAGRVFTFSGRGYGHGVGMSQWGAYGMAQQGYSYVDILTYYFTGITIK
ncbi:MAG: SpoIID/LytB domain-containing protein [Clostridia bacterium]